MRRSALQQLARQATLTSAGPAAHCGALAEAGQGVAAVWQAAAGAGCRPTAAAAQPWLRGLHAWAAGRVVACQHQLIPAAVGSPHSCTQQQQQQWRQQQQWWRQQQRGAAAQAAEAQASSSSSSDGGSGLTLSDAAVERLKELQAESSAPVLLRVTVEGGGCSGFQYEFAIEEGGRPLAETDRLFERGGVGVVVDDISLDFLKGAQVDFESDLMRSAFVVAANPNAASSCGCGSSFVAK